jgi:hypothetical protein
MLAVAVASADLRAILCMSNTNADDVADTNIVFLSDLTLDEFDGSGYAREALANITVNKDDANNRAEVDCDDLTYGVLGAGTRTVLGVLIYRHVGADSANIPWSFHQYATAKTMDGSDFTSLIDADGLLQLS